MKPTRTDSGFRFGAADVACMCTDEKRGWVVVGVNTPKHRIQVYVTKSGRVRVHDGATEWKPVKEQA